MAGFPDPGRTLHPRACVEPIHRALPRGPNVFLAGPRQAGKTSVLHLLGRALLESGTAPNAVAYADLEDPRLRRTFDGGVPSVVAHLRASGHRTEERLTVFLDEVHLLADPSNLLKLLADHHPELRLVFTASSTHAARAKFRDSMAGRHVAFEVLPLSLSESLPFRGLEHLRSALAGRSLSSSLGARRLAEPLSHAHAAALADAFEDHVRWGGFPAVALEPEEEARRRLLDGLLDTYLRRDLRDLFTIGSPGGFESLLHTLAGRSAGLLNVHGLSHDLAISRPTILRYLLALEATFVVARLLPFFTNPVKQLVKMPKIHFVDPGIRNRLLEDHRSPGERPDGGALVESAVFAELRKTFLTGRLHYWRTKSGAEVDFVWRHEGEAVPIEVRFARMRSSEVPSGLRAFVKEFSPRRAFVLTRDTGGEARIGRCRVRFLPAFAAGG